MNRNQGVSIIALTITIIAIIILSAIVVRIGTSGIEMTEETRYSTERKEIESAIINRFSEYALNSSLNPLIGKEVSTGDIASIEGINVNNIDYIRRVNASDLQSLSIKNTTGAEYIVDYLSGKVFGPLK